MDFSGIEPKPQGFHVKLTINAEGSQGADKKHKVFWVKDAAEAVADAARAFEGAEPRAFGVSYVAGAGAH